MKEYLSYHSTVAAWKIPYSEVVFGTEIYRAGIVDVTFLERNARSLKKCNRVHLCEMDLPSGAVVLRNGQRVASPELLFLQFASKLSIHSLILFGLQLCSYPPGNPEEAITTKQKLTTFIKKTANFNGHRKAMRALKYVTDGSASIMESMVYMVLTLPNALGGYGLKGATFNYEVRLTGEYGKRLGQKHCFIDLYYRSEKLGIEYDSFAFHSSPTAQGKDIIRAEILARQGIGIMRLSTIQLYDKSACADFALNLAARLGRRIQIRAKRFDEMHAYLRALLPISKDL